MYDCRKSLRDLYSFVADIIILDDNFSSIVSTVMWGRCVYVCIFFFFVATFSFHHKLIYLFICFKIIG